MSDNPLSGQVSLDVGDFKSGISQINRELRVIESGFKASAASMEDWADNADGLTLRLEALGKQIDLQKQKVDATRRMYAQLAAEKGESSRAAQDMQIRLNKETEALNRLEREAKQAGSALEKMKGATTSAATGLNQMGKGAQAASGAVNLAKGAMDAFNLSTLAGIGGVTALANTLREGFDAYSSYVDEVNKASIVTGVSVEQLSRLVQVADDLRIEQDDLVKAMEKAVENGFVPSIENIAALSDEVMAISDPIRRADVLSEKFGKSWREIAPLFELGGDAIRENAAAIAEHMVVTEEAVRLNTEYLEAVDELNDSWTNFLNMLAKDAMPILSDLVRIVTEMGNIGSDQKSWTWIERIRYSMPGALGLIEMFLAAQDRVKENAESADTARATQAWAQRWEAAVRKVTVATGNAQEAMDQYNYAIQQSAGGTADALKRAQDEADKLKQRLSDLDAAQKDVTLATQDLQSAQENWLKSTGNDVARALEQAGVKGEDYSEALGAIDDVYGTTFVQQAEYNQALKDASEEYAKTGDLAAYRRKLQDINGEYMPMAESIREAKDELWRLKLIYDNLKSKTIKLTFETNGVPGSSSGGNSGGGQGDTGTGNDDDDDDLVDMLSTPQGGPQSVPVLPAGEVIRIEQYFAAPLTETQLRAVARFTVEEIERRRRR